MSNATDKNDPNNKHYFQSSSEVEFAESMISYCKVEKSHPVTLWEKGEDEKASELYIPIAYNTDQKLLKLKPTGSLVTKITGSTKAGKEVLIKVKIHDKMHYFTGGKLKFHAEDLSYSLEINQDIFKSQKRGNIRLNASEAIPIQFKIDEQVYHALDISTGGTSFEISSNESDRFAKGKLFKDCTLRFDRKNYYIPQALVAMVGIIKDQSGNDTDKLKIGISFKDLPRKTEEELYIKVTTEARGEEMKKKFDTLLAKKAESN